jgi:TonB family protein
MDSSNNPLPFANITNSTDNVGTYADAKGNFTLISPDSVLNVQIRSVGFENNNIELRSDLTTNKIILQEDRSVSEVVLNYQSPNASRLQELRESNIKIEEPEPADGWDNYDTYLVNNLNAPDEQRTKRINGQVEISFDVNKNGEPTNIKIERSLCKPCDDEAIRLVKEGPKWKRRGKSRARVAVPFNE